MHHGARADGAHGNALHVSALETEMRLLREMLDAPSEARASRRDPPDNLSRRRAQRFARHLEDAFHSTGIPNIKVHLQVEPALQALAFKQPVRRGRELNL